MQSAAEDVGKEHRPAGTVWCLSLSCSGGYSRYCAVGVVHMLYFCIGFNDGCLWLFLKVMHIVTSYSVTGYEYKSNL